MCWLGTLEGECKTAAVAHASEMSITRASGGKCTPEYFGVTIADGSTYVGARKNAEVEVTPAGPTIMRMSVYTK